MGIKDLSKQLKESGHFRQVEPSEFQGLRLGVDGMVWLHRAVSMASNEEDYCRRFHAEPQVPFHEQLYRLLSDELRFWQNLGTTVPPWPSPRETDADPTYFVQCGEQPSLTYNTEGWKSCSDPSYNDTRCACTRPRRTTLPHDKRAIYPGSSPHDNQARYD